MLSRRNVCGRNLLWRWFSNLALVSGLFHLYVSAEPLEGYLSGKFVDDQYTVFLRIVPLAAFEDRVRLFGSV